MHWVPGPGEAGEGGGRCLCASAFSRTFLGSCCYPPIFPVGLSTLLPGREGAGSGRCPAEGDDSLPKGCSPLCLLLLSLLGQHVSLAPWPSSLPWVRSQGPLGSYKLREGAGALGGWSLWGKKVDGGKLPKLDTSQALTGGCLHSVHSLRLSSEGQLKISGSLLGKEWNGRFRNTVWGCARCLGTAETLKGPVTLSGKVFAGRGSPLSLGCGALLGWWVMMWAETAG